MPPLFDGAYSPVSLFILTLARSASCPTTTTTTNININLLFEQHDQAIDNIEILDGHKHRKLKCNNKSTQGFALILRLKRDG